MDRRINPGRIWSLLPGDIVTNIGGCLLATGDVDYYVDMRAACRNWRASMDDPKDKPADTRFLMQQWVMLDEELPRGRNTAAFGRLFLNTVTGRFVRKELSGLADYYFVISTGGLLVLATRSSPHTVLVVNPLTASCIKFKASIPDFGLHTIAHLHLAGSAPTLVLEHQTYQMAYCAKPDDEHFTEVKYNDLDKAHNIWGIKDDMIDDLLSSIIAARSWDKYPCFYFLESTGEMLFVVGRKQPGRGMEVFKVNIEQKLIEPITSIGSRALFLGDRSVSVDVDKLPSIDGNCIFYYGGHNGEPDGIYMYDLGSEKEEEITSNVIQFIGLGHKPIVQRWTTPSSSWRRWRCR